MYVYIDILSIYIYICMLRGFGSIVPVFALRTLFTPECVCAGKDAGGKTQKKN